MENTAASRLKFLAVNGQLLRPPSTASDSSVMGISEKENVSQRISFMTPLHEALVEALVKISENAIMRSK